MNILSFVDEFSTFEELKKQDSNSTVIINLNGLKPYPLLSSFIIKIFRYSKQKGIRLVFITENSKDNYYKELKKFVEIYSNIDEFENVKIYTNYEIKIYESNLYIRKLMKEILIDNNFKIKERSLENFFDKSHDCKYNSFYIVDYSKHKNKVIEEIQKIKAKNKESIVVLLTEEKDLEIAISNMGIGIDYVIIKPFETDEFIKNIQDLALESYYKYENKILLEKVTKSEREIRNLYNQIDDELKLAQGIQKSFLPEKYTKIGNYEFNYEYRPSLKISGDFYENIKLNDDEIFIAFSDLSGHGIPAALLSSMVKMSIQNRIDLLKNKKENRLKEFLYLINEDFINVFPTGKFVSMFCGILNIKNNTFTYSKASQEPVLLLKGNEIIKLETDGVLLGMFSKNIFEEAVVFEEKEIEIFENDKLIFYTDGITELENNGEYFENRFYSILKNNYHLDNNSLIKLINDELLKFNEKIEDDMSLLIVSRFN